MLARPDGTILRANPAACRALGRSKDEIRREGRNGLVVEGARLQELLAVRESSNAVSGELSFRRPDGSTFPVELTTGFIPSGEGAPFSYVMFRDITVRRRSEESLRRSNRALRLVTLCNEALVRATTEAWLFAEVCKTMVEAGGYRMCWVGLAEPRAPVASHDSGSDPIRRRVRTALTAASARIEPGPIERTSPECTERQAADFVGAGDPLGSHAPHGEAPELDAWTAGGLRSGALALPAVGAELFIQAGAIAAERLVVAGVDSAVVELALRQATAQAGRLLQPHTSLGRDPRGHTDGTC